jgi:hypothetical protein
MAAGLNRVSNIEYQATQFAFFPLRQVSILTSWSKKNSLWHGHLGRVLTGWKLVPLVVPGFAEGLKPVANIRRQVF